MFMTPGALELFRCFANESFLSEGGDEATPPTPESTLVKSSVSADMFIRGLGLLKKRVSLMSFDVPV